MALPWLSADCGLDEAVPSCHTNIRQTQRYEKTKRLKFIVGLVISSYIKPVQMTVKNNYGRGEKSKLFETRQLKEERRGWSQAACVIWNSGVTKKANHVTWKCVCSASPQTWTQIRPKLPFWTHSLINLLQQLVILAKVSVGWLSPFRQSGVIAGTCLAPI